jgi:thymidylate synthase (FAD)
MTNLQKYHQTIKVELFDHMGSDQKIADCARVSFGDNNNGKTTDLLYRLMEHDHSSPFEMGELVVKATAPLYIVHQWQRHRTFSYNQISLRYTKAEKDNFFIPETLRIQSKTNKQGSDGAVDNQDLCQLIMQESIENSFEKYDILIANGVCREQARAVLPTATNTTFICKGNLKNWLHFIKLRQHETAQKEIRWFADKVADMIAEKFPVTYDAFKKFKVDAITFTQDQLALIKSLVNGNLLTQAESGLSERHYNKVYDAIIGKEEPSPTRLIMDYMQKRIEQIDKSRIDLKSQYPDLLP